MNLIFLSFHNNDIAQIVESFHSESHDPTHLSCIFSTMAADILVTQGCEKWYEYNYIFKTGIIVIRTKQDIPLIFMV